MNMDLTRSIVRDNGSTYYARIPKKIINSMGIKSGDKLFFMIVGDHLEAHLIPRDALNKEYEIIGKQNHKDEPRQEIIKS